MSRSGAGIPLAFAADFTARSIADALERKITTGRVNLGKSLLGGAENALSQMLYGTGELKGVGDAFWRGAKTGALSSGFRNIEEALWPERSRDPKGMCGSPDPFELSQGFGNGRGYHSASAHGEGGFSLGGLVKDMVVGGIVGGLGSAGFYGAGKAVDALKSSVVGRRNSGTLNDGLGALDWKHTNRKGQTALEHVQKHGIPNYQREMHGVFRSDIQTVVESAWANRGNARVIADGMGGIVVP